MNKRMFFYRNGSSKMRQHGVTMDMYQHGYYVKLAS